MPSQPQMCFLQPVQIAELQQPEPGGAVIVQAKKMPQAPVSKWRKNQQANQGFRWQDQKQARFRDASVDVRPDWVVKGQITFDELRKCNVEEPTAVDVKSCGTLHYYDKAYDRVTPKTEKPLAKVENVRPLCMDFFKQGFCNRRGPHNQGCLFRHDEIEGKGKIEEIGRAHV